MLQHNCLSLRDVSMANRILNQDILYRPTLGAGALFVTTDFLPARTFYQPVKKIEQNSYDK